LLADLVELTAPMAAVGELVPMSFSKPPATVAYCDSAAMSLPVPPPTVLARASAPMVLNPPPAMAAVGELVAMVLATPPPTVP
jgi:hypothetical protein